MKSGFIRVASHELRSPISGLAAYHGLLSGGALGPLSDEQQRALDAMREFLGRLTGVADDAALVAQVQGERLVLEMKPCEAEPLLRLALATAAAHHSGRRVQVTLACEPLAAHVHADEKALTHAITHLLRAAVQVAPDDAAVSVRAHESAGRLRVDVRASAVALPAERLAELLAPGEGAAGVGATEPDDYRRSGLRLGLLLARSVAEAHAGTLTTEMGPDGSLALALELPLDPQEEIRAAA